MSDVTPSPIGHHIHHYNNDFSHDHIGETGIKIEIMRNYVTVIIAANSKSIKIIIGVMKEMIYV